MNVRKTFFVFARNILGLDFPMERAKYVLSNLKQPLRYGVLFFHKRGKILITRSKRYLKGSNFDVKGSNLCLA